VKNGVDLVFTEDALQEGLIAADELNAAREVGLKEKRLWDPVSDQANGVSVGLKESANEPAAHETGSAGDEGGPSMPKGIHIDFLSCQGSNAGSVKISLGFRDSVDAFGFFVNPHFTGIIQTLRLK
jgi:hypothetical protein